MLRLFLGLRLVHASWSKWLDDDFNASWANLMRFCRNMIANFDKTLLPDLLTVPFMYALPWVEILLGSMLLLGLFTRQVLVAIGFLLAFLAIGVAVLHQWSDIADNAVHLALAVAALLLVSHNKWTLWPRQDSVPEARSSR